MTYDDPTPTPVPGSASEHTEQEETCECLRIARAVQNALTSGFGE